MLMMYSLLLPTQFYTELEHVKGSDRFIVDYRVLGYLFLLLLVMVIVRLVFVRMLRGYVNMVRVLDEYENCIVLYYLSYDSCVLRDMVMAQDGHVLTWFRTWVIVILYTLTPFSNADSTSIMLLLMV